MSREADGLHSNEVCGGGDTEAVRASAGESGPAGLRSSTDCSHGRWIEGHGQEEECENFMAVKTYLLIKKPPVSGCCLGSCI